MIDGILIVDKELGITSYDVVRKIKRVFSKDEKIGHAGTLDPLATGILIVLFGKATKLFKTMHQYEKVYEVEGELGFATDTQDMAGEIINKNEKKIKPLLEDIIKVIEADFIGNISQIPPIYSAKKIAGKRAYDLAREGKEVNIEPVNITVSQFEVYEYSYPTFRSKIKCSTGTYIRTLINDLGIKLGTFATTKKLRRISIGDFNVSEAVPSEEITNENIENVLRRIIKI